MHNQDRISEIFKSIFEDDFGVNNLYISQKPFWISSPSNVPNFNVFHAFALNHMRSIGNIYKLNYIDKFTLQIVMSDEQFFDYFAIYDRTRPANYAFYYLEDYTILQSDKNTPNGFRSAVYTFKIDIWMTYAIHYLSIIENKSAYLTRTMKWSDDISVIGDETIDNITKAFASIYSVKKVFSNSSDDNDTYFWNTTFGLSGLENNAYKYFVFNDGPNNTYTLFPCINETKTLKLYKPKYVQGEMIYESTFIRRDYKYKNQKRVYETNISAELNTKIKEAYQNGDFVEFAYRTVTDRINWVQLNDYQIFKTPYSTMPVDWNATCGYETQTAGFDLTTTYITCNGEVIYEKKCDGITAGNWNSAWERIKATGEFRVRIYKKKLASNYETVTVYNNKQNLYDTVITNHAFTNKFLGIYAGPHLLNFDINNLNVLTYDNKQFITISLPENGIIMNQFNIFTFNYNQINGLNNQSIGFKYLLKYLNVRYYNNFIDAILRVNSSNKIYLSGRLLFSDGFYLLSKNTPYLANDQSIISYGGMLPTSKDLYKEYVNSKRNSLDTSYAIMRNEASLKNLKAGIALPYHMYNGYVDAAKEAMSGLGSLAGGNIGKTGAHFIEAGRTMVNTNLLPFKLVESIFNEERKLNNKRRQLVSDFADINVTMGNNISMSNVIDVSNMNYMESNGDQYECVEIVNLQPDIYAILNNYLYMNGFPKINQTTLEEIEKHDFYFIKLADGYWSEFINYHEHNYNVNSDIKLVHDYYLNGFRLWNDDSVGRTNELTLPDINVDNVESTSPDYVDIPIPPPNPDIIKPEPNPYNFTFDNITINSVQNSSYQLFAISLYRSSSKTGIRVSIKSNSLDSKETYTTPEMIKYKPSININVNVSFDIDWNEALFAINNFDLNGLVININIYKNNQLINVANVNEIFVKYAANIGYIENTIIVNNKVMVENGYVPKST